MCANTVFAVIPVHNRWQYTRCCLEALAGQTYENLRVVVVDDGSTDGSPELIAKHFPGVTILSGNGNLWWTGAVAVAVEWVLERCAESDYILTLNNDVTCDPDYVEQLIKVAEEHGPRILVGSVAVDSRDRDTVVDGGTHINWVTAKGGSYNAGASLRAILEQGIVLTVPRVLSGRGTLIPVRCIQEIGNFDAHWFPHYGADYEFAVRATRAGYGLVMSYRAQVYSVVTATGLSVKHRRLNWREFVSSFFSRRSPACLLYRWRFAVRCAPPGLVLVFLIADTARVIVGGLRDQVRGV